MWKLMASKHRLIGTFIDNKQLILTGTLLRDGKRKKGGSIQIIHGVGLAKEHRINPALVGME